LLPHTLNCAGLLTLDEFIALVERSSLFLTSDSGPMHIAASVGTPVVALFGPESPHFYGPLGHSHVIYKGIACSPCLNIYNAKLFVCPFRARCMSEIPVHEVVAAARRLLPAFSSEPA
jgi:ADP-heptose:LPS heptosyltransferase